MGFTQGLSGLNAAAGNLDTIGNNIANSKTVGYKAGRTEFADVFAGTRGLGVQVTDVSQDFSGGPLESTGRNLDLAIDGGGFFRLADGGQVVYSRNGQFHRTKEGYIANAQGALLSGYNVSNFNNATADPAINTGGAPAPIHLPTEGLNAKATTGASLVVDLDAGASVPPATPFDPADADTYNASTPFTVFDSLGNAHSINLYFAKTGANNWTVNVDGSVTALANFFGGTPPTTSTTLSFDTNGNLTTTMPLAATVDTSGNGSNQIDFDLSFAGSTQTAQDFRASDIQQNGHPSGDLTGIAIQGNGMILGSYSNGQSVNLAQVALARFASKHGLEAVGNNAWVETAASGQPQLGLAGSGQFGGLLGGTLEGSNVDLSKQLVKMIIAQRTYQANAQTIKTQSQLMQTAVNLAR